MTSVPLIGKTRRVARAKRMAACKLIGEISLVEKTRKAAELKDDKAMLAALTVGSGAVYGRIPETLKGLDPKSQEAKVLQACLDDRKAKVDAVLKAEQASWSQHGSLQEAADRVRRKWLKLDRDAAEELVRQQQTKWENGGAIGEKTE